MEPAKKQRLEPADQTPKPWVEKYRPKTLDDVASQEEVIAALRACLKEGSGMPHVLFHGPPGTGKTSTVLALAYEMFGPDYIKTRVRELNASDERGIAVVRDKIKKFAHGSATAIHGKVQSDGKVYVVPGFKLVILDEADALLPDAQAALRRMMEDFSEVTRFCILCNYVSRIIDPIASRCAKFRFKPLTKDKLSQRILHVATAEGLKLSPTSLENLDFASKGDLRMAIMYLQNAAKARGADLTAEDFVEIAGQVPNGALGAYLTALSSTRFDLMYEVTLKLVTVDGYSATQVIQQLHEFLTSDRCPYSTVAKSLLSLKLTEAEKRLLDRGDDLLQLLDVGAAFVVNAGRQ